jgi:hypothetical protein
VNYGNGVRLFEGQLRINSLDGKGKLFDEFSFQTTGIGQDPYQASGLRIEKNGLYRYDMQFRIVNYFNRLPSLWSDEHGLNSERIFQNHDLTLLPGSRFEILLGYDRNNQNGPGFSSESVIDTWVPLERLTHYEYGARSDQGIVRKVHIPVRWDASRGFGQRAGRFSNVNSPSFTST